MYVISTCQTCDKLLNGTSVYKALGTNFKKNFITTFVNQLVKYYEIHKDRFEDMQQVKRDMSVQLPRLQELNVLVYGNKDDTTLLLTLIQKKTELLWDTIDWIGQ